MKTLLFYAMALSLWLVYLVFANQHILIGSGTLGFLRGAVIVLTAIAVSRTIEFLIVEMYFERWAARDTTGLLRVVLRVLIYFLVIILVLHYGFDRDVTTLLATSAVLSVVLGLALQPTLGNLFSGAALEIEHPLRIGDFVRVSGYEGRIYGMNWRSMTLQLTDRAFVVVPNSDLTNLPVEVRPAGTPTRYHARFSVPGGVPPSRVLIACRKVMQQPIQDLLHDPASSVLFTGVEAFSGTLQYEARYFTDNFMRYREVGSDILEILWYALKREGIPMTFGVVAAAPLGSETTDAGSAAMVGRSFPVGDGGMDAGLSTGDAQGEGKNKVLLSKIALFSSLDDSTLQMLAMGCWHIHFTQHERIPFSFNSSHALHVIASGEILVSSDHASALKSGELQRPNVHHGQDKLAAWSELELSRIELEFAYYVGPIAKVLVREVAALTRDPFHLYHKLGEKIDSEDARAQFLSAAPLESHEIFGVGSSFGEWAVTTGTVLTRLQGTAISETDILLMPPETLTAVLSVKPEVVDTLAEALAADSDSVSIDEAKQRILAFHRT